MMSTLRGRNLWAIARPGSAEFAILLMEAGRQVRSSIGLSKVQDPPPPTLGPTRLERRDDHAVNIVLKPGTLG